MFANKVLKWSFVVFSSPLPRCWWQRCWVHCVYEHVSEWEIPAAYYKTKAYSSNPLEIESFISIVIQFWVQKSVINISLSFIEASCFSWSAILSLFFPFPCCQHVPLNFSHVVFFSFRDKICSITLLQNLLITEELTKLSEKYL